MATAQQGIDLANSQVGYQEGFSGGHWNNIQKYSPEVPGLEWSQGYAWCCVFVCWILYKLGGLRFKAAAYTGTCIAYWQSIGRWSEYPAIGAQVFFGYNGCEHTGFVTAYDATTITTIEGNTNINGSAEGDGVYRKTHNRTDTYVFGYGYPEYEGGIQSADPVSPGGPMRIMYDSTNPADIPADAQMVAGYVDGIYAWSAEGWARFPNAVKVRIAVFSSTNDGHVLDVEPGCSTPASAPGWVLMRRAAGVDPSVYCNTSTWPTVKAAFQSAGVPEPHWWIAAYPGNGANLYAGSVAHQYANPLTSGGHFDLTVVGYWPGVDGTPVFPTAPTQEDDEMKILNAVDPTTLAKVADVAVVGGITGLVATAAELDALKALDAAVSVTDLSVPGTDYRKGLRMDQVDALVAWQRRAMGL
jgi:CHAP domain